MQKCSTVALSEEMIEDDVHRAESESDTQIGKKSENAWLKNILYWI